HIAPTDKGVFRQVFVRTFCNIGVAYDKFGGINLHTTTTHLFQNPRFSIHPSIIWLNSSGCSIIAACPHLSIQNKLESGKRRSKSVATSGGVTLSCFPQIMQVGVFILGRSLAILWRMALLEMAKVRISLLRSFTVLKTSSTISLVATAGS